MEGYTYSGGITGYFEDSNNNSIITDCQVNDNTITSVSSGGSTGDLFAGRDGFKGRVVISQNLKITTSALPNGTVGEFYSSTLKSDVDNVEWSWSGNTPISAGLSLNASTGVISGTPTTAGTYSFTLTASKSGYTSASTQLTISIVNKAASVPQIKITTTSLEKATVGTAYIGYLDADVEGVTWSWSGNTPTAAGLSINSSRGLITGTPTTAGTYSFTLTASKSGYTSASVELTLLIAGGGLAINNTNFPDSNFRSYVSNNIDKDSDGYLSNAEIAAVKTISVENSGISSLKGIECFTALEKLDCFKNQLTALDVSKNTALTWLKCSDNQLTSLNVSSCTALDSLTCSDNQLTSLNVSACTALAVLWCDNNQLIALNVSKNTALTRLWCENNQLTILDVSNNTALESLNCSNNQLTSLNVSSCTALEDLNGDDNQLTSLNVSACTALTWLYCNDNNLISLILGNNSALREVECQNNSGLKNLDIRGCPNLSKDNITYDSGLNIISDKGDQTPKIEIPTEKPEFTSFALSLEDRIAVVFYFYLPPDTIDFSDEEKCYMEFDIKGGTSNETSSEKWNPEIRFTSSKSGKTYYGFKCYINSAQMAENITATLHFNGESFSAMGSVKEYLDMALESPAELGFSEKQIDLMYAIMDYGHYAQAMLAKKNEQIKQYIEMPGATDYTDADIAEVKTKAANYADKLITNISRETMSGIGVSLNLDSQTTLNIHYSISSTYKGTVSATIDGKTVDIIPDGQGNEKIPYKVSLPGIASNQLGTTHTINLIADGAMNTVTASGLSYVDLVFLYPDGSYIEGVDIDTMRRAMVALFNYYEAAKAYFPE